MHAYLPKSPIPTVYAYDDLGKYMYILSYFMRRLAYLCLFHGSTISVYPTL